MKVYRSGRRSGKTTDLIKESARGGGYIVCANLNEVSRIMSVARDMKKDIPMPISFYEFLNKKYYSKGIKSFLIDDADELLQSLTDVEIDSITITV